MAVSSSIAERRILNVESLPTWTLAIIAVLGVGILGLTLLRMMPPPLRRGSGGGTVATALGFLLLSAVVVQDHRLLLWLSGIGSIAVAFPLLWMGPLPADMPSARDPACRRHPKYDEVARRGAIAGTAFVILELAAIIFSVVYVKGL